MTEPKKSTYQMSVEKPKPVAAIRLPDPLVEDCEIPKAAVTVLGYPAAIPQSRHLRLDLGDGPITPERMAEIVAAAEPALAEKGVLLVTSHAALDDAAMARVRAAIWPAFHVFRAFRLTKSQPIVRVDADGSSARREHFPAQWSGSAVAAIRRAAALAPDAITRKFDKSAAGWSGEPASPLYAHHRWMRRIVAELGAPKAGERALDAGCGAGWVGIEAAKLGAAVTAFDPSPEMVKLAEMNAAGEKVALSVKPGFVEQPAEGEPFPLVLNSGVISFSPDPEKFLDALDARVARGGRLVIGDLNPLSRGMARRRSAAPVLPIRELNALPREDVERRLAQRGYRITARRYYQLTDPVPQLMHFCAKRLSGLFCGHFLRRNAAAASRDSNDSARFDSWLLRAEKP